MAPIIFLKILLWISPFIEFHINLKALYELQFVWLLNPGSFQICNFSSLSIFPPSAVHVDSPPTIPTLTTSYAHGTSSKSLLFSTVGGSLQASAERFPDREAVVFLQEGVRKTFSQLQQDVSGVYFLFSTNPMPNRLGVQKGSSVVCARLQILDSSTPCLYLKAHWRRRSKARELRNQGFWGLHTSDRAKTRVLSPPPKGIGTSNWNSMFYAHLRETVWRQI